MLHIPYKNKLIYSINSITTPINLTNTEVYICCNFLKENIALTLKIFYKNVH